MSGTTGNGSILGRDAFLRPAARRYKTIDVPGLGLVRIRNLTEREKSIYEAGILGSKKIPTPAKLSRARSRLICAAVVGDDDQPLFSEDDAPKLADMDGAASTALYQEIAEHCGMAEEESAEELAKNSELIDVDG